MNTFLAIFFAALGSVLFAVTFVTALILSNFYPTVYGVVAVMFIVAVSVLVYNGRVK
jgi:hypothetical protein